MDSVAISILERLQAAGHTAYFAGGCVRDYLRGITPADFDIATSATPTEVEQLFSHTTAVGARFGVILVHEQERSFEVATFRSDEAYVDGRHPSRVHYGSPREDAQRRDFTVNALFYDPHKQEVLDYVGGQQDLQDKIIRAVGQPAQRFAEDKLRLLRCVRFAATLGFAVDPETFQALQEMASTIHVVSAERIRDELVKLFKGPQAARGLDLLDESGLLAVILPEISAMKGVEQPAAFHPEGDVFQHVRLMLAGLTPDCDPVLSFSVLLHDVGKPPTFERAPDRIRFNNHDRVGAAMAEQILKRLRFPNRLIEQVVTCVAEHMRMRHVQDMRIAKLKRVLRRDTFDTELELHRLDCTASHGSLDNYHFLREQSRQLPPESIKPGPLITGHDVMALGVTPGPMVGQILREVEEQQLEERLGARPEALAYVQQRVATMLRDGTDVSGSSEPTDNA